MTEIETNGNIRHTKGDTLILEVTPLVSSETEEPYFLKEGEYIALYVRRYPFSEPVLRITTDIQQETGVCVLTEKAENMNLKTSSYTYDVKLHSADGTEIYTFIGGTRKLLFTVV
ncbi:MAG: hypothetical protein J6B08_07420 [Ruminiclostridium sp.]|nr:hypothetical protein [Ruminiclostridium sp.]